MTSSGADWPQPRPEQQRHPTVSHGRRNSESRGGGASPPGSRQGTRKKQKEREEREGQSPVGGGGRGQGSEPGLPCKRRRGEQQEETGRTAWWKLTCWALTDKGELHPLPGFMDGDDLSLCDVCTLCCAGHGDPRRAAAAQRGPGLPPAAAARPGQVHPRGATRAQHRQARQHARRGRQEAGASVMHALAPLLHCCPGASLFEANTGVHNRNAAQAEVVVLDDGEDDGDDSPHALGARRQVRNALRQLFACARPPAHTARHPPRCTPRAAGALGSRAAAHRPIRRPRHTPSPPSQRHLPRAAAPALPGAGQAERHVRQRRGAAGGRQVGVPADRGPARPAGAAPAGPRPVVGGGPAGAPGAGQPHRHVARSRALPERRGARAPPAGAVPGAAALGAAAGRRVPVCGTRRGRRRGGAPLNSGCCCCALARLTSSDGPRTCVSHLRKGQRASCGTAHALLHSPRLCFCVHTASARLTPPLLVRTPQLAGLLRVATLRRVSVPGLKLRESHADAPCAWEALEVERLCLQDMARLPRQLVQPASGGACKVRGACASASHGIDGGRGHRPRHRVRTNSEEEDHQARARTSRTDGGTAQCSGAHPREVESRARSCLCT